MIALKNRYSVPGALQVQSRMLLHTPEAQRLVTGYKTVHGYVGLWPLLSQVRKIYQAARLDDPYADLYLLKLESSIAEAKKFFEKQSTEWQKKLRLHQHLRTSLAAAHQPLAVTLQLGNPFAYQIAALLGLLDEAVRWLTTLKKLGIAISDPHRALIQQLQRKWLKIFYQAINWKSFGLTRADVMVKTEKLALAENQMGILPEAILNKTLRAHFAPPLVITHDFKMVDEQ